MRVCFQSPEKSSECKMKNLFYKSNSCSVSFVRTAVTKASLAMLAIRFLSYDCMAIVFTECRLAQQAIILYFFPFDLAVNSEVQNVACCLHLFVIGDFLRSSTGSYLLCYKT